MAYTNELSYLLEDDDKSIEPVHAVYLVSPIDAHQGRIQDFVLGGGHIGGRGGGRAPPNQQGKRCKHHHTPPQNQR